MCGIAGIIGGSCSRAQIQAMLAVQSHRGPDASGIYMDDDGGAGLGHNRLSIIDLSTDADQPMQSADGRLWIVFNGEIYNYKELRKELRDYPFRTQSDTEVILAAYRRWDKRCVDRFIGMFSFAIWDEASKKLFCARDRLGIKPFYYTQVGGQFIFGSEVKSILAAGVAAQPDQKTWSQYLAHGYYDHSRNSFFSNVQCLPGGHTLTIVAGKLDEQCYWNLPEITLEPLLLTEDEAASRFLELFEDAVRLRLRSDVPLGVNLSGGLDSASLMVTVDHVLGGAGDIQTFTASFDDPRYDEKGFAELVRGKWSWIRNVQRLDAEECRQLAEPVMWHQEAPFGGIATLAYHHLHSLARSIGVTVLLEGQGVDEMLGGYGYFRPQFHLDLIRQGNCTVLRRELRADPMGRSRAVAILRDIASGEGEPMYQDGTSHLRTDCINQDVIALAGPVPLFEKPFPDNLTNALYRDIRHTKLPRVLRMNDRLSMAHSRELREPYLDHRIVELLFRIPANQKIRDGKGKYLLRKAMQDRLPDSVRGASKRDVVTPQREWLRKPLRSFVEEIINSQSFRQRGWFEPGAVRKSWDGFCNGQGDNAFFIWQWINSELWCRCFLDNDVGGVARSGPGTGSLKVSLDLQ